MGYQKRIGMDLRRDRVLNEYSGTYGQVKISENKWGEGYIPHPKFITVSLAHYVYSRFS